MATERWVGVLRDDDETAGGVQPIELFFDLVFVLAVTQVTHRLMQHLTLRGMLETLLLLLAMWMGWINTTWTTNYFDTGRRRVRLVLLWAMFASLILSASIPRAFENRGLAFAVAIVALLLGTSGSLFVGLGRRHQLGPVIQRVVIWWSGIGVLWIAGGLVHGDARFALWLAAIAATYAVTWLGFPVPRLGVSRTTDYTIEGAHMAERCYLFITLALGESILITGSRFGALPTTIGTDIAFGIAFLSTVGLWWIYFDRAEDAAAREIADADDPGHLGLIAYTFGHVPLVAGIIVAAVADELTIPHPHDPTTLASGLATLGGPALYLAGHAGFKWMVWRRVSPSRIGGLLALGALIPVAFVASRLMLLALATAVLLAVVLAYVLLERHRPRSLAADLVEEPAEQR